MAGPRQFPSLNGWRMAVNSLLLMWESLREQDIKFPLTSSINQDCVKNLFSIVGAKGAQRDNPDAEKFRGAIQQVCIIIEI